MPFEPPLFPAALVAYFALGANLLGTGLLLLIQPHSRGVRWHAAFSFWIMAWLALQGWFALQPGTRELYLAYGWVVHLMPAFFFAAALVETRGARDRTAVLVVLLGVLTAPFLNPAQHGARAMLWQATMWGIPALLHFRFRQRDAHAAAPEPPGKRALHLALFVIVPAAVIGIITLRGAFLLYAMPLITVLIQFMIFHGVVHHRFYDIEVRAARSGELASHAAEQERLALLGELSATLAHELRNPLAGIRSLAQRLAEPRLDAAKRARYVDVVLGEIGRLDRIVGNLLDAAKRSTVRAAPGDATPLAPLFDDVLLLVDARARRAGVTLQREPTDITAAAPRDALAQALLNLLLNAIAHTPAGGRVELGAVASDDAVEIRVRDTGPGVPAAERARIFEPFHTHGIGAGLGLAVVRRIARELGWHVHVGDADGGGAVFSLLVPAVHAPRAQRAGLVAAAANAEPERRAEAQPSPASSAGDREA
jgi:signal transduction histidine kinase